MLPQLTWSFTIVRELCSRIGASSFSEQHPVRSLSLSVFSFPLMPFNVHVQVLLCRLQGEESGWTFPVDSPDLISERKGWLWKNSYGIPLSFSQSQSDLLIRCSLSLSHFCVCRLSLLSSGFSLNSQSPLLEGPSSPVGYESSFYSSTLLPSYPFFCCWLLILQSSSSLSSCLNIVVSSSPHAFSYLFLIFTHSLKLSTRYFLLCCLWDTLDLIQLHTEVLFELPVCILPGFQVLLHESMGFLFQKPTQS